MSLVSLIRLLGFLVSGWIIAAIGAAALGVVKNAHLSHGGYILARPTMHDVVTIGEPLRSASSHHVLIDRGSGRLAAFRMPEGESWDLLAVSPWCDSDGNLEIAGRWFARVTDAGARSFCGLVVMKLPERAVVGRVPLDVLPTSRPCWFPGRRGKLIFTAGDGQLHRCKIAGVAPGNFEAAREVFGSAREAGSGTTLPWNCTAPGGGTVFLSEPFMTCEPRLWRIVIVALRSQTRRSGKTVFDSPRLWWIAPDEGADAIEAAGPLTEPQAQGHGRGEGQAGERYPHIAIGSDGRIRLVYLAVRPGESSSELCSADLELDSAPGVPLRLRRRSSRALGASVAAAPVVVSADGESVLCQDVGSGEIVRYRLAPDRPTAPRVPVRAHLVDLP
jgi:hypothetical protein